MRNVRYKIALLICGLLFFMTGCGQTGGNLSTEQETTENSGLKNAAVSDKAVSWQAGYAQLKHQYDLALATDQVYGCYVKDDQIFLDIIDRQELFVKETLALSDASSIAGMAADQKGNVYLLGNRGESTGLWRIDAEGNLWDYAEIELEDTDKTNDLSLKGIFTDPDGTLFVWCKMMAPETEMLEGVESEVWHWEDRVYVKDEQLHTLFYEKIADMKGTDVLNFQVGTDGRPIFVVKDSDGVSIQEIDVVQKGRKDAVRLEKSGDFFDPEQINRMENIISVDNGLLCCIDNELYEFHFDTQKAEKLFNLSTYGIFSSDILFLTKRGDEVEIIDNHGDAEPSELISFAMGKSDKKTLALGMVMAARELKEAAAEFNRYSREYRVELVDYFNQTEDYDKAMEQLKLDVVTGTAPDIIAVSGIDYR